MKVVIIGGTGTLGQATTKRLLNHHGTKIHILSRDELKQKQMAAHFNAPERLFFRIGDVRDASTYLVEMEHADVVFHFAALKHIEVAEDNPEECIKTNLLGTIESAQAAIYNRVPYFIFSSTDKAVDPVNVYGMTKAISERILLRLNEIQSSTKFSVFRWGNVVGSRGSAIPEFAKQLKEKKEVGITDAGMTRFWIPIDEAVTFMLTQYMKAPWNEIKVPPLKGAEVVRVIAAVANKIGLTNYQTRRIGMRKGEKLHEAIYSQHSLKHLESNSVSQLSDIELAQMLEECAL